HQRRNVPRPPGPALSSPAKKSRATRARQSQTGRLHVWETWDHEDPEFRARPAETVRVEDLCPTYSSFAVFVGGISEHWHAVRACLHRLCIPAELTFKNASLPLSSGGNPGRRRCAWNGAIPRDR